MLEQQEDHVNWLNKLIEICRDGNSGYKAAASKIEDDELKTILYRLSQQRALFEAELQGEVRNMGGKEEHSGTAAGGLHRAWMNVKEAFSSDDTESLLEECKRGDKAAVEVYEKALKADLPAFLKEKVQEQFNLIRGAITQLGEFERSHGKD